MRIEMMVGGPPAPDDSVGAAPLPNGGSLTEAAFYQERDHRTQMGGGYRRTRVSVAVAAADDVLDSAPGQTALLWAASMVRRSGRPFAGVRLVAPSGSAALPYLAHLHAADAPANLGEAVEIELTGADPFAQYAWDTVEAPTAFDGIEHVIWLGRPSAGGCPVVRRAHQVIVDGRGWVIRIEERLPTVDDTRADPDWIGLHDAAPAAVIAGVAFAAAAVFRQSQREEEGGDGNTATPDVERPNAAACYWYSVDTGAVTADPDEGGAWLVRGSSALQCAPWAGDANQMPRDPGPLVLVSAGGLGGNFAQILGASWVALDLATIADPDVVDVANLNRLIGVLLADVGSPKADVATRAISNIVGGLMSEPRLYETWAVGNRAVLDAPGCVVVVGVDQVLTRLEAQADWPGVLLNGSTAGTTWHVSAHHRGGGACVGCLFAGSRGTYAETRRPQACGAVGDQAGAMNATRVIVPPPVMASYPFVSVSAAASLVAWFIRLLWARTTGAKLEGEDEESMTRVHHMNTLHPLTAMTSAREVQDGCLLLCGHPALDTLFARSAPRGASLPTSDATWESADTGTEQVKIPGPAKPEVSSPATGHPAGGEE